MIIDLRNHKEMINPFLENFFKSGFKQESLIENNQQIVLPYVDIKSKEWYFDGIRIGYSEWTCTAPVSLKWSFNINTELITLFVNLKGKILFDNDSEHSFSLDSNQHNLFYSIPGTTDDGLLVHDNSRLSMFMIQFPKDFFLSLTQDSNTVLSRFAENILKGSSMPLSFENQYLDINMREVIGSILNCMYSGGLKKMFLLSKSIELLVLQAEAYNNATAAENGYLKSSYDKKCIQYAMEYLSGHLQSPPSLNELTKIIGINGYKLKRGFKETFGTTVFGYVADARLLSAKKDLAANDKSISEIAALLGYSSVSHFSNAFKKKFGLAPSQIRSTKK